MIERDSSPCYQNEQVTVRPSPAERQCRHCGERFTPHEEVMGYNICPRCFA